MLISKEQFRRRIIFWTIIILVVGFVVALNLGLFSKSMDPKAVNDTIVDRIGATTNRASKTHERKNILKVRDVYVESDTLNIDLNANSGMTNSFILVTIEREVTSIMFGIHDKIKIYDSV